MRFSIVILSAFTLSVMMGCASKKNMKASDSVEKEKIEMNVSNKGVDRAKLIELGFTNFTTNDMQGLDGCGIMLLDENGKDYLPINLKLELQKPNLSVWLKYSIKNIPTTCMRGVVIEIREYWDK